MLFLVTCQHFLLWFVEYMMLDCTCSTTNEHNLKIVPKFEGQSSAISLHVLLFSNNQLRCCFSSTLPIVPTISCTAYSSWYVPNQNARQYLVFLFGADSSVCEAKGSFCVFLQAVRVSLWKLIWLQTVSYQQGTKISIEAGIGPAGTHWFHGGVK